MTLASAAPAAASCDGPVPSFREFAPRSQRIVIGTVIRLDPGARWTDEDWSSRFTLRVEYVVRGQAPARLAVHDEPFLSCADHVIIARVGDRLALAFDVTGVLLPEDTEVVTIPAWLHGTPQLGGETITVREVFALVGRPVPPATSTEIAEASEPPAPVEAALLASSFGAGLALWRRRRPRTSGR